MKKRNLKKSNVLTRNYRQAWDFFLRTRKYMLFAAILFLVFAIVGFIFPVFFANEIMNFVKELSAKIGGYGPLQLIGYILWNNARASLLAIVLGVLAGIFPLITAIFNGYLLGFVARQSVNQQGVFILWKLFPHGIFELPAVIMSIGIGIYLGKMLVTGKKGLGKEFIEAIRFFILVVLPLLIVAGIIEGLLIYLLK